MKLWTWLNGKKTYIGAAFFFASCFMAEVVVGFFGATASWIEPTIKTLEWIGMAFTTTGFTHKFFK